MIEKQLTIWLIAMPWESFCGGLLRTGLEEAGHRVIQTDPVDIQDKIKHNGGYNYYIVHKNYYPISPPENLKPDLVIVDISDPMRLHIVADCPIVYWHREQYWIPSCDNAHVVLYGCHEAHEFLHFRYPDILTNMKEEMFFHYAADPRRYKQDHTRIPKCVFIGVKEVPEANDWIYRTAYAERKYFLDCLTHLQKSTSAPNLCVVDKGYTMWQEYEKELPKYEAALILFGRTWSGLRLYETIAAGCVPIIWIHPQMRGEWIAQLQQEGFIAPNSDKLQHNSPDIPEMKNANCFFFENYADIEDYFRLPQRYREQIRNNAFKLSERFTPKQRAIQLLDFLDQTKIWDQITMFPAHKLIQSIEYYSPLSEEFRVWRECIEHGNPNLMFLDWLYNQQPNHPALIHIMRDNQRIMGEYSLLKQEWFICGKPAMGTLCYNVAIHEHYRNKGFFVAMGKTIMNLKTDKLGQFTLGFPNEKAFPGHMKVGWIDLGNRPILEYNAPFACGIIPEFEQVVQEKYIITQVHRFIDITPLMSLRKLDAKFMPDRTAEWLNWRYFMHPINNYQAFLISVQDELLGYVILKLYHDERENKKKLHIMDFLIEPTEGIFRVVMFAIFQMANQLKVDLINIMINPDLPFAKYLIEKIGFTTTLNPGRVIVNWHGKLGDVKPKVEDFYLTFGQTDNY